MGGNGSVLLYTTIGELIKKYRGQASLSITQLANVAGIHKTVISKIENGDTRRPEWKTLKAIAGVLKIPPHQIVEHYVELEQRPDALLELLLEAIELADMRVVSRVALTFLESPREETYTLLERLYHFAGTVTNAEVKLTLYHLIVKYSRERGVPPYIAKGLLQAYLIERLDLKRLEESFRMGEEIIHYVDFLTQEEQILFYYRMALHAHNTKKYQQCIQFCKAGLALETADTELTARAYLAMINSYFFLENFDAVERHLDVFETFDYGFVPDAAKTTRGIVKAKKKDFDAAIPILRNCLDEGSRDIKIHAANELMEVFFQTGEMDSIAELLKREEEILPTNLQTPYKHVSIGRYYQQKAKFQTSIGLVDEGMKSYAISLQAYGTVNALEEIMTCLNDILSFFSKSINLEYIEMIQKVYNEIVSKCKKQEVLG
ncbi:helix-turn-helix domain-containing protein [Brevibacillus thermoruber]|uniref:helix-turn-helix domain-containing protein n=1 Tax=Brevibacillus thermoruber TaxID=33942 RepID=UPI004041ED85